MSQMVGDACAIVLLSERRNNQGGVMLRKHIVKAPPSHLGPQPGEMDIAATATVQVTSEDAAHPIEHGFDHRRGPGGSRWIAAEPGEQTLILAFDSPPTMDQTIVEVEEREVSRTQELQLSVSHDGGQTYREMRRQEYNFSPPGTTFERAEWTVMAEGVTHLQLGEKPPKGGNPRRAAPTSVICKSAEPSARVTCPAGKRTRRAQPALGWR